MHRKYFYISIVAVAVLLLGSAVASAQTGELRGHVLLKQADGTTAPLAGAAIDVFRTDIAGSYKTKTDKKGTFVFAGLPYIGTYTLAASAPNAAPAFLENIKAGRDIDYELVLGPGDGKRLTIEEIRAAAATSPAPSSGGTGTKESAEARAKREEIMRKNAEIEAKNKKITESNTIVSRTFKAGNEALIAKRYDEAIAQYNEGIAADETHPAVPVLLTNKSVALRSRGVDRYNAAIQSKDDAAKTSGLEAAKKDFREAAEASTKAVELIKAEPAPTDPTGQTQLATNKKAALNARAEAMRLFVKLVDQSQADAGLTAYQELIAAETDPAKKSTEELAAAQMLLDANAGDKAAVEFRKILQSDPNNVDALLGMGLSLFNTGDKSKYQEAANYLQQFVDKAPDTNRFKKDARDILEALKQENVRPEKTTTGGRRRRG